jgi:hypothetical protein
LQRRNAIRWIFSGAALVFLSLAYKYTGVGFDIYQTLAAYTAMEWAAYTLDSIMSGGWLLVFGGLVMLWGAYRYVSAPNG